MPSGKVLPNWLLLSFPEESSLMFSDGLESQFFGGICLGQSLIFKEYKNMWHAIRLQLPEP